MRRRDRFRRPGTVFPLRAAATLDRAWPSSASLLVVALLAAATGSVHAAQWTPLAELRVRQEILDGVYHFAAEPDRNWIRVRASAGVRWDHGPHRAVVVLRNEHRHHLTPAGIDFTWNELFLDQASWSVQTDGAGPRLTVGRQNIVWPGGLLMLDGNPLAGSRSMFHNAVRVQSTAGRAALDLALIHNPKRDPVVLAGSQDLAITDADETALALRLDHGRWAWSAILKSERDPDGQLAEELDTATVSGRLVNRPGAALAWHAEVAVQFQRDHRWRGFGAAVPAAGPGPDSWAWAADLAVTRPLSGTRDLTAGAFYYSGRDGDRRPFRTPWGRWPKWSELYIYTLIGESTGGRVHAAAWENIAAPHATLVQRLRGDLTASLGTSWLLAPAPRWQQRGWLTRAELTAALGPQLQGHLRWEMLVPGAFHDGRDGWPPLTRTVHFLRWQLTVNLLTATRRMPMAPFNLPWSTFGAFVVLGATILLALIWAVWDRAREKKGDRP